MAAILLIAQLSGKVEVEVVVVVVVVSSILYIYIFIHSICIDVYC